MFFWLDWRIGMEVELFEEFGGSVIEFVIFEVKFFFWGGGGLVMFLSVERDFCVGWISICDVSRLRFLMFRPDFGGSFEFDCDVTPYIDRSFGLVL